MDLILIYELNLVPMVNFPTWLRLVLNEHRKSIIDDLYTSCPLSVNNIQGICPYFGNPVMVTFTYSCVQSETKLPKKVVERLHKGKALHLIVKCELVH